MVQLEVEPQFIRIPFVLKNMKIDAFTKTITLESAIDLVPAQNYLNRYLTKTGAKEWKIREGQKRGLKSSRNTSVEEESVR